MKRRPPTAADRPKFQRDVADALQRWGVQVGDPGPDAMIVCSRAADFDPASNVLWELDANKSAVRPDVLCCSCQSPLAMSHYMYGKWSRLDPKPKTCCTQCMLELAKAPS